MPGSSTNISGANPTVIGSVVSVIEQCARIKAKLCKQAISCSGKQKRQRAKGCFGTRYYAIMNDTHFICCRTTALSRTISLSFSIWELFLCIHEWFLFNSFFFFYPVRMKPRFKNIIFQKKLQFLLHGNHGITHHRIFFSWHTSKAINQWTLPHV